MERIRGSWGHFFIRRRLNFPSWRFSEDLISSTPSKAGFRLQEGLFYFSFLFTPEIPCVLGHGQYSQGMPLPGRPLEVRSIFEGPSAFVGLELHALSPQHCLSADITAQHFLLASAGFLEARPVQAQLRMRPLTSGELTCWFCTSLLCYSLLLRVLPPQVSDISAAWTLNPF